MAPVIHQLLHEISASGGVCLSVCLFVCLFICSRGDEEGGNRAAYFWSVDSE